MQMPSQPDEGYSEDPLNPTSLTSSSIVLPRSAANIIADFTTPSDLPAWLSKNINNIPVSIKHQLALTLLDDLPTWAVAEIAERLHPRLYIDFIQYLPPEVCLKILGFLDPVSLLNVARSCRAWYDLAVDRKLWERLYHMEGWRAVYSEIEAWETRMNEGAASYNSAVSVYHRVMASEGGHTSKKRAISEDHDLEMPDVDRTPKAEDSNRTVSSIFANPSASTASPTGTRGTISSATPNQLAAMDIDGAGHSSTSSASSSSKNPSVSYSDGGSDIKGKGKAPEPPKDQAIPPSLAKLLTSSMWTWDALNSRYRLNWRYVYSLRRRLESNWDQAKFINFQLPRPDHPEEGHQECIYTLQFDSEYLVSGSRDRTIRIWSMATRRLLREPLKGHDGSVLCLQFDSDPEEDIIVSGSSDSNVIIWRFSTGEMIQRLTKAHTESVLNVKFNKRILVTCSKDKSIKIFNRRPLKYGDVGYGLDEAVNPVPIRVRDYRYGSPTNDLPIKPAYTMIGRLEGHGAAVNAVQIYGNEVVSASGDRNIKVWDWPQQICSRTVVGHGKGIACVQYDGRRIVSGSSDNEVKVFDRFSGLEVASLKAHSNLVRTVQAGFGDLPYSEYEDKAEAKKLDEQYLKALESGAISANYGPSSHRSRPRNPGSRKLEDITAYGANLPPGGGGGKYARIVSGSYDQKIIIWRRDKEGIWGPAHRLRQEEAAEAAQAWAVVSGAVPPQNRSATQAQVQAQAQAQHGAASTASTNQPVAPPVQSSRSVVETPIIATITPESAASFAALIDIVVPQGITALQNALASYPTMLVYHAHLHAAINREPSPSLRASLRQVVSNALLQAQHAQLRTRLASMQASNMSLLSPVLPPRAPTTGGPSGPSSSRQTTGGSGNTSVASVAGSTSATSQISRMPYDPTRHTEPSLPTGSTSGGPSTQDPSDGPNSVYRGPGLPPMMGHNHAHGQYTPQAPSAPIQSHSTPVPLVQAAPPLPPPAPAQTHPQPQPHGPTTAHAHGAPQTGPDGAPVNHPHLANADNSPARVFKLQFDARRIICCSQTSVIVGWDFCNGDPELEHVARIFGTVE